MTSFHIPLALVLVMVAVLLAAGYIEQNSDVPFEIPGSTQVIVKGAGSPADLASKGVANPEKLSLPERVGRYDLVIFDIPGIQKKLEAGQDFPVRIRGKEYFANISWKDTKKNSDGIVYYAGKFPGDKFYYFHMTEGSDVILGTVTVNGERFVIGRAEKNARPEYNSSPLHYIYSMNDVGPFPTWLPSVVRHPLNFLYYLTPWGHEGGLCGGEFEVYELDYQVPHGNPIVLREKDFTDFPELGAVIRGGKNTKATCDTYNVNRYRSCVGGGNFRCNEGGLVHKYETVLFYDGKYYELRRTVIS